MTRAKDYKHVGGRDSAAPRASPGRRPGFAAGLALGLALTVAVHFYHVLQRAPAPAAIATEPAPQADTRDEQTQDYDFFRILSEMEIVVPEHEPVDPASLPTYILQAGSFRTRRTAEFLQEKLKTLALESEVQQVEMNDGSVWYRVRLGPYDSLSRVNNIRLNLRKQGIESLLKRR